MRIGDIYRNDPAVFAQEYKRQYDQEEYGAGPFMITKIEPAGVSVKSIITGRSFGPWSHPRNWGILDTFLTEAYRANEQNKA